MITPSALPSPVNHSQDTDDSNSADTIKSPDNIRLRNNALPFIQPHSISEDSTSNSIMAPLPPLINNYTGTPLNSNMDDSFADTLTEYKHRRIICIPL